MRARIIGTGSYLPEHCLTNDDLSKMVDTNDAWIQERTGIRERRITDQGTASMAVEAGARALEAAGKTALELDLILVGTTTPDYFFPSVACQVQGALGASHAACFDISAACTGFIFALNTAQAYIVSGMVQTILVIGAETLSRCVDWTDRSTCVLFGDGAGAAVVQADEMGMLAVDMGSDGKRDRVLTCEGKPLVNPVVQNTGDGGTIHMDGQEVFKFAVRTVPESIRRALNGAGIQPGQVKQYILHQANQRILDSVRKHLKLPEEAIASNIACYGNTSAATVPILLDEISRSGKLSRGDLVVLSGFGAGLTWGTAVLQW